MADELIGKTLRNTPRYALACRSVGHRSLRELCGEASKAAPRRAVPDHIPTGSFDTRIRDRGYAVVELQGKRHAANYDPRPRFRTSDALLALLQARTAMARLMEAPAEHRQAFLTLPAFPPRGAA
ncbi:hypothetical protein JMJ56_24970 [Belnapia sp. T18]|uniref:Uncharacterized protein n=1 Tax=Belnapia arida TaxID=2804533 RepID=A0ABS1U986_9PROT|nr:hypothetical protein [Belnapia arida]MBL6081252.1 hypothetical protein [Belnapia arida]